MVMFVIKLMIRQDYNINYGQNKSNGFIIQFNELYNYGKLFSWADYVCTKECINSEK